MPTAEMISGVTIGDSSIPMIAVRPGIAALDRPSAATVPSTVASAVAAAPMTRLLTSARSHSSSPATLRYQRSE